MSQGNAVEELFLRAIELDGDHVATFLEAQCPDDETRRQVLELLENHREASSAGFMRTVGEAAAPEIPDQQTGSRIGRYVLRRVLGRGGMGVVWLAESEEPRREVAIKLIAPAHVSEDSVRRFEIEAAALARLKHPAIAQIYEAGVWGGGADAQPYLVMELVRGVPITQYARERELDVPARIELVATVCDGVEHAHQRGVIHRDLKPGNILVEEAPGSTHPLPKILDFGIARLTDDDLARATREVSPALLIGTLSVMSPEQLGGDPHAVDTRSDVYALGVMLFELLGGRPPHDLSDRPIPEAICRLIEVPPARLASVDRSLRGDLDIIAAKALERDPSRRYQSAADLARDLRRFLASEPIAARPPSRVYLARKFCQRHTGLVVGASAALLALVGGAGAFAWQADRASAELATTREMNALANELLRFMVDPDVRLQRDSQDMRELDRIAARIEGQFRQRPRYRADLLATTAGVYIASGRPREAEGCYRSALDTYGREGLDHSAAALECAHGLGEALIEQQRTQEGIEILGSALQSATRHLAPDDLLRLRIETTLLGHASKDRENVEPRLTEILATLGSIEADPGDVSRAQVALATAILNRGDAPSERRAIDMAQAVYDELGGDAEAHRQRVWEAGNILVQAARRLGEIDRAVAVSRAMVRATRSAFGDGHWRTARSLLILGGALADAGEWEEGDRGYIDAIETLSEIWGDEDPRVESARARHALLLLRWGRTAEAEEILKKYLFEPEITLIEPATIEGLSTLGYLYIQQARQAEAEACFRRVLPAAEAFFGFEHRSTLVAANGLGVSLRAQQKLAEAAEEFGRFLPVARRLLEGTPDLGVMLLEHGHLLTRLERYEQAEPTLLEAQDVFSQTHEPTHRRSVIVLRRLAELYGASGRPRESVAAYDRCLAMARDTMTSPLSLGTLLSDYGVQLTLVERYDEGEAALLEGHAMLAASRPPDDKYVLRAAEGLADLYSRLGRTEDAAEWQDLAGQPPP